MMKQLNLFREHLRKIAQDNSYILPFNIGIWEYRRFISITLPLTNKNGTYNKRDKQYIPCYGYEDFKSMVNYIIELYNTGIHNTNIIKEECWNRKHRHDEYGLCLLTSR